MIPVSLKDQLVAAARKRAEGGGEERGPKEG